MWFYKCWRNLSSGTSWVTEPRRSNQDRKSICSAAPAAQVGAQLSNCRGTFAHRHPISEPSAQQLLRLLLVKPPESRDGMLDSLATDEARDPKTWLLFSASLHSRAIKKSDFCHRTLGNKCSFSGLSSRLQAKEGHGFLSHFQIEINGGHCYNLFA